MSKTVAPLITRPTNKEPSQEQLENLLKLYKERDLGTILILATYLLAQFPNSIVLNNFLGDCHTKLGNFEAAIENYKVILKSTPQDYNSQFNLANLQMYLGEFDEALNGYQKVLDINSTDFETYNNMGICWEQKGKLDNAITSFQRAIELNPKLSTAYENLTKALEAKTNLETGRTG